MSGKKIAPSKSPISFIAAPPDTGRITASTNHTPNTDIAHEFGEKVSNTPMPQEVNINKMRTAARRR